MKFSLKKQEQSAIYLLTIARSACPKYLRPNPFGRGVVMLRGTISNIYVNPNHRQPFIHNSNLILIKQRLYWCNYWIDNYVDQVSW